MRPQSGPGCCSPSGCGEPPSLSLLPFRSLLSEIQLEERLGAGAGGTTWKCRWRTTPVAVKMMVSTSVDELRASTREAVCSRIVSHPCVVQCYAINITRMTEQDLEPPAPTPLGTRTGLAAVSRPAAVEPIVGLGTSPQAGGAIVGGGGSAVPGPLLAAAAPVAPVPLAQAATAAAATAATAAAAGQERAASGRGMRVVLERQSLAQRARKATAAAAAAAAMVTITASKPGADASAAAAATATMPPPCGSASALALCTLRAADIGDDAMADAAGAQATAGGGGGGGGYRAESLSLLRGSLPDSISEGYPRASLAGAAAAAAVASLPPAHTAAGVCGSGCGGPVSAGLVAAAPRPSLVAVASAAATAAAATTASPSTTTGGGEGYGSSIVWWADGTESVLMELEPGERSCALREELLRLGAAPGKFLTTLIMEWCDGGTLHDLFTLPTQHAHQQHPPPRRPGLALAIPSPNLCAAAASHGSGGGGGGGPGSPPFHSQYSQLSQYGPAERSPSNGRSQTDGGDGAVDAPPVGAAADAVRPVGLSAAAEAATAGRAPGAPPLPQQQQQQQQPSNFCSSASNSTSATVPLEGPGGGSPAAAGAPGGAGSLGGFAAASGFGGGGGGRLAVLLRCALEVAQGMAYLHSLDLAHGDLTPKNVLLKSTATSRRGYTCKISDFGLSNPANTRDCLPADTARWGTLVYMAPDVLTGRGTLKQADVYSFGAVLWHMAIGGPPHQELRPAQVLVGLATGELTLAWPDWVDPRLARIGRACMHPDPARRPPFEEVVRQLLAEIGALARSARSARQQRAAAAAAAAAAAGPPAASPLAAAPSAPPLSPTQWQPLPTPRQRQAALAPPPPPQAASAYGCCEWQPVSLPLMQLHRL